MATFKDFLGKEADKHDVVLKREQERKARMIVLLAQYRRRIDAFDQEYNLQRTPDNSTSGKWSGTASQGLDVIRKHLPKSFNTTEANLKIIADKVGGPIMWNTAEISLKTTVNYAGEPVSTSGNITFTGQTTFKGRSFEVQYFYMPGNQAQSGQRKVRFGRGSKATFTGMNQAWDTFLRTEGLL